MANVRKKISELTTLTAATLDTTYVVGISGSTTYKISINQLTSSLDTTFATDLVTSTLSSSLDSKLSTASFNSYTASISTGSLINRLSSLESYTSSFSASAAIGTVSSSAQITALGFISSSTDISSLNSFTSSQSILNSAFTNGINVRVQTASFNDFSASVHSEIVAATNEQSFNGLISGSSQFTASYDERYVLSGSITQTTWDNIVNKPSGIVSQSTDLSSLNTFTASISTASLVTSISNLNIFTSSQSTSSLVNRLNAIENVSASWITESETGSFLISLNGAISSSSQLTSSFDIRYTLSGSVQNIELPSNLISGSSQLTSSYDTRYTLSGSVVSGTTPAGTISGSSQLTSSFDGRYTQTGSFNTLTQSFNSFTASAQSVTTGSNSFNGTQTITGSLIITTGSFVASQILANTASLYLTSGSNMYVQNNGVVEITGSLRVSGSAAFNVTVLSVDGRSGDEGGEINLAIPVTNTSLQNRVAVDIFQNRLRIFEGSADAKGVYIDLSKAPAGNSAELLWKTSGYVNAGTFLTLDNVKVSVTTTSNRGLSIGAVSTSFVANIGGTYGTAIPSAGGAGASAQTYTTTASASAFGWNFGSAGDISTYILNDTTNSRVYRITLMIGTSYNNNFITIERLH